MKQVIVIAALFFAAVASGCAGFGNYLKDESVVQKVQFRDYGDPQEPQVCSRVWVENGLVTVLTSDRYSFDSLSKFKMSVYSPNANLLVRTRYEARFKGMSRDLCNFEQPIGTYKLLYFDNSVKPPRELYYPVSFLVVTDDQMKVDLKQLAADPENFDQMKLRKMFTGSRNEPSPFTSYSVTESTGFSLLDANRSTDNDLLYKIKNYLDFKPSQKSDEFIYLGSYKDLYEGVINLNAGDKQATQHAAETSKNAQPKPKSKVDSTETPRPYEGYVSGRMTLAQVKEIGRKNFTVMLTDTSVFRQNGGNMTNESTPWQKSAWDVTSIEGRMEPIRHAPVCYVIHGTRKDCTVDNPEKRCCTLTEEVYEYGARVSFEEINYCAK